MPVPVAAVWKSATLRRSRRTPWQARQAIKLWLTDNYKSVIADATQIISELVNNVLVHVPSGNQRDWVKIRIGIGGDFVRLSVIDPGLADKEPVFSELNPDYLEESGRGLAIVADLSVRCGTNVNDQGHRIVWADLPNGK